MTIPNIAHNHVAFDIALTLINTIRPAKIDELLEIFGSSYRVFALSDQELCSLNISPQTTKAILENRRRKLEQAYAIFERCSQTDIKILVKHTPAYPQLLAQCSDAPYVLYMRGSLDLNKGKFISCVGSRHSTAQGIDLCVKFVRDISSALPDAVIVSGLALGIDSVGHQAAIDNGLPTIAVMPGWVDDITPRSHYALARNILAHGGAIVSEMPPGTAILGPLFLVRNRIIAGLSHATIVAQSGSHGGSMVTADLANNYNRDVFAPAADPQDVTFEGNMNLIKSDRATMLQDVNDICLAMNWQPQLRVPQPNEINPLDSLSNEQLQVLSLLPQNQPCSIDALTEQSCLSIAKVSIILTSLELKGMVKTIKGRLYQRSSSV